jgi:BirA family biotin operon repressor/biotin-[acetyl-CoA-carboxylase] ligase
VGPDTAHQWSFVAGLALHDAISARTGLSPLLKWPNDVVQVPHTGTFQKVAGILCTLELSPSPAVIVGVGLNLAFSPDRSVAPRGAPLALGTANAEPTAWLANVLLALEARAHAHVSQGAAETLSAFRSRMAFVDQSVEVTTQAGVVRGICRGVTNAFELLVDDPSGATHRLTAADVWPMQTHEKI